LVAGGHELKYH